jgi:thioredoxin-related protein
MRPLFLLPLISFLLMGAGLSWEHDYRSALAHAMKEQKKIFVFISDEECDWCRKLETTTLGDDAIVGRLSDGYRSVHVTRGKDDYPSELQAVVVPMCYFLTPEGKVIDYARGYWDATDFNLILDDVEKRMKKMKTKE